MSPPLGVGLRERGEGRTVKDENEQGKKNRMR